MDVVKNKRCYCVSEILWPYFISWWLHLTLEFSGGQGLVHLESGAKVLAQRARGRGAIYYRAGVFVKIRGSNCTLLCIYMEAPVA